jgi:hypothetical protein
MVMSVNARKKVEEKISDIVEKVPESLKEATVPYIILLAEEISREMAEQFTGPFKVTVPSIKTEKVEYPSQVVSKMFKLANVSGIGKIREMIVDTDSADYRIDLTVDGQDKLPFHSKISDLMNVSPHLEYLDVFEEDGKFTIRVSNINFVKGFQAYISPITQITMNKAIIVYDIESTSE